MADKTHINKLDEVIKQTLSNYEAPNNVSDWEQMERMLDTAPQSSSLKQILLPVSEGFAAIKASPFKRLLSPYVLLGLALAGGAYFLYHILRSPKIEKAIVPAPQQTNSPAGPSVLNPVLPSNTGTPAVVKADSGVQEQLLPDNAEAVMDVNKAKADEAAALKEKNDKKKAAETEAEKIKKEKKEKAKKEMKNNPEKLPSITQEKHDSVIVTDTHVGEIRPNYQPSQDSIQRNQNQNLQPKDSVQVPH